MNRGLDGEKADVWEGSRKREYARMGKCSEWHFLNLRIEEEFMDIMGAAITSYVGEDMIGNLTCRVLQALNMKIPSYRQSMIGRDMSNGRGRGR